MWFWIVLIAFFLIVFLVTKAVTRSQGGVHHVGLQQGHDVSLSGGWGGAHDGSGGSGDASAWSDGGAGGDGGDGGGW